MDSKIVNSKIHTNIKDNFPPIPFKSPKLKVVIKWEETIDIIKAIPLRN